MSLRTVCKRGRGNVKGEASIHWPLTHWVSADTPASLGCPCSCPQWAPTGTSGGSIRRGWGGSERLQHISLRDEACQCKPGQNLRRKDHSGSMGVGGLRGCEAGHKRCLIQASKGCWVLLAGFPAVFFPCSFQGLAVQLSFRFYKPHHNLPVSSFWAHISYSQFLLLTCKTTNGRSTCGRREQTKTVVQKVTQVGAAAALQRSLGKIRRLRLVS